MIQAKSVLFCGALLTVTAFSLPAQSEEWSVLESRGVKLKSGDTVEASQKLTLLQGQRLTLLSPSGKTVKLQGPVEQAPADEAQGSTSDLGGAVAALITERQGRREQGAIRNGPGHPLPEPWIIDVTENGQRCVMPEEAIIFWRGPGGGDQKLTISPADRSWQASAEWPAGSEKLLLRNIPIRDRASYAISLGSETHNITLNIIPRSITNDAMRLTFLYEKMCDWQGDALSDRLKTAQN